MNTALRTKNLTKYFGGVAAISDLSIEIPAGIITSIVGPNGAGKTTLLGLLSGFVSIDHGTITIGANTMNSLVPHEALRYGIMRTFQSPRLFWQMSVIEHLMLALTRRSIFGSLCEFDGSVYEQRAAHILRRVGLFEKQFALAENLSYGQRKLLEIARVMAMDAQFLFFDESFAGLSAPMTTLVMTLLQEFRAAGKTIIVVEHDMQIVRSIADHIIVLDGGRLLAEGTPRVVLHHPAVREAYLGQ